MSAFVIDIRFSFLSIMLSDLKERILSLI